MNDEHTQNQNLTNPISDNPVGQEPKQPEEKQPGKLALLKNKKVLIGIAVIAVVISSIIFFFVTRKKAVAPDSVITTKSVTETVDSYVVNGNTYYKKPSFIKGLVFSQNYRCTEGSTCENGIDTTAQSYLIGKTKNNEDIILFRGGGPLTDIILVKKDTKYEIVLPAADQLPETYDANVSTSSSTKLDELVADKNITIQSQPLARSDLLEAAFVSYDNQGKAIIGTPDKGTKLYTQGNIDYYVKKEDKGSYTVNTLKAYFKDLISYNVTLSGELGAKDSKAAENIVWSKGEQTSAPYTTGGAGCGSGSSYVAADVKKSDLTEVGKTPQGQIVYRLDPSHPIATEIYTKDYDKGTNLEDAKNKNLSVQQFNDKHGYFLIENGFGEYVVYINDNFVVRGGCAKPVVYLYPKTETKVSVVVGANVTVSDPLYPNGGWRDVLARPNGQLRYQGREYGSLFWEGQGNGEYPAITQGTIVNQNNLIATIEKQLAQQGLQGQEITDFINFWKPNLPKDPYVRLTWLTQPQINKLAPLQITPRPNTTIRVFLDFEGLTKPVTLSAQQFATPKREGFTVVEWGGLARTGLGSLIR